MLDKPASIQQEWLGKTFKNYLTFIRACDAIKQHEHMQSQEFLFYHELNLSFASIVRPVHHCSSINF